MTGRDARLVAPEPGGPVAPLTRAPTFSVVIPAYQAEATIADTIESVLAQTRPPLEVIVADDGSEDGIADVLATYGDAVRHLRLPHRGVAAARNAGVEEASGDFVLILDADDVLLPRKLEALAELAVARPDLDLLSTDVLFETDGRRVGRFGAANRFATSDQRAAIIQSCFVGWPAVRRSRLLELGGFDTTLPSAVDWECWIRLILAGSTAGLYDEPLSVYRVHPTSMSARRVESLRSRARMLEKTLEASEVSDEERDLLRRSVDTARSRVALAEAEEAIRDGEPGRRRRALAAARAGGLPLRVRAAALAAAAAPTLARTWLRRRGSSLLERRPPGDGDA